MRRPGAAEVSASRPAGPAPTGFSIHGTPHDITVDAVGSRITIQVDGVTVLDFNDSAFASAVAGPCTCGDSVVNFLSAKALAGNGALVVQPLR